MRVRNISSSSVGALVIYHIISLSMRFLITCFCSLYFNKFIFVKYFFVDDLFQEKYGIEPTMVVHGVKMLYVPVMPGHSKRLKLT